MEKRLDFFLYIFCSKITPADTLQSLRILETRALRGTDNQQVLDSSTGPIPPEVLGTSLADVSVKRQSALSCFLPGHTWHWHVIGPIGPSTPSRGQIHQHPVVDSGTWRVRTT